MGCTSVAGKSANGYCSVTSSVYLSMALTPLMVGPAEYPVSGSMPLMGAMM